MFTWLFKKKLVLFSMVLWALFLGIMPNLSQASLVESKIASCDQYQNDLAKVKAFVEKDIVAKRLHILGMDKEEFLSRLEKLDAQQIHELAMRCDKIKIGGSPGGIFIAILIIGFIIIAILYFTDYVIKIEPRSADRR